MYHTIACWEEGDEIVMIGCRIPDPMGWESKGRTGRNAPLLGNLRIEPYLSQWRLNMRTGAVDEAQMDDRITEFPRINDQYLARQAALQLQRPDRGLADDAVRRVRQVRPHRRDERGVRLPRRLVRRRAVLRAVDQRGVPRTTATC